MMDTMNSSSSSGHISGGASFDRYKGKSSSSSEHHGIGGTASNVNSSKTSFDSMFKFNHNTRVSITLVPAILLILFLRGRSSILTAALTVFITYIIDLLNLPFLTLTAVWCGLLVVDVSLVTGGLVLVQHSLVNIFLLFNIAMLLALIGVWVSLQFKWITSQYPNLSSACERILFGVIAYPTSVVFTWFSIIINGVDYSPFYLLSFLLFSFYAYALPLRSFRLRSSKQITSTNDFILSRLETGLMAVTTIAFPAALYVSIYHSLMFESDFWLHMSNITLLVTIPSTFVFLLSGHGSLWWILPSFWNSKIQKRPVAAGFNIVFKLGSLLKIVCLVAMVAAIEYRILHNSSAFYSSIKLQSPLAITAITVGMYASAAIFYLVAFSSPDSTVIGHIPVAFQVVLYSLIVGVALAITYLLSAPFYVYPLTIAAVLSFSFHLFHNSHSLPYYIFLGCSIIVLKWFINDRLYFLEYIFEYPYISIQLFTTLIIVLYVLSMLLLFYSYKAPTSPKSKVGLSVAMLIHSLLLAFIEVTLNTSDPIMYPLYIVYATSIVTIYLTNRLLETRSISFFVKVVCDSAAIAKALSSHLLLPSTYSFFPCFLFTAVIYGLIISPSAPTLDRKYAFYQAVASFVICAFYPSVPLRLLTIFVNIDDPHSTAIRLSAFLLSFAICIFNLSFKFYPQNRQLRNIIVLLFTSGVVLLVVNPTTSATGQQQQRFALGNWLLIIALLTSLFGTIYRNKIAKSTILKVTISLTFGTLIGLYFSLNYFTLSSNIKRITKTSSNEWAVHALIAMITNTFSLFMMYAHYPSLKSPRLMNAIYAFFVTLFPITYILLGSVYMPYQSIKVLAHLDNARLSTLALAAGLNLLIVMYLKYHVSTVKHIHSKSNTAYMNSPLKKQGSSTTMKSSSDDWVFSISSFACLLSYLASVSINLVWLGGSELCVFVLSPLLLLLNTERGLLKKLSESHRYAPMLFAISTLLTLFSLIDTLAVASNTESSYEWYRFFGLSSGFWRVWWNFKNWVLLMTTLPSVFYINRYLWKFERQSQFRWLIISPPAILSALFSDIMSINLLGAIGFTGAILQRFISGRLQKQSNQVI